MVITMKLKTARHPHTDDPGHLNDSCHHSLTNAGRTVKKNSAVDTYFYKNIYGFEYIQIYPIQVYLYVNVCEGEGKKTKKVEKDGDIKANVCVCVCVCGLLHSVFLEVCMMSVHVDTST